MKRRTAKKRAEVMVRECAKREDVCGVGWHAAEVYAGGNGMGKWVPEVRNDYLVVTDTEEGFFARFVEMESYLDHQRDDLEGLPRRGPTKPTVHEAINGLLSTARTQVATLTKIINRADHLRRSEALRTGQLVAMRLAGSPPGGDL